MEHLKEQKDMLQNKPQKKPVMSKELKERLELRKDELQAPKVQVLEKKAKTPSAATLVRNMLLEYEKQLTTEQIDKLFDREFMSKYCGISMELFIPSVSDQKRYISGRSRYMKKPIQFYGKSWFMTNDIHKPTVQRLQNLLDYFVEHGDVDVPEPEKKPRKKRTVKPKTQETSK